MRSKLIFFVKQSAADITDQISSLFRKSSQESVYFYTFHKCASTLFSDYVLKNIQGLRHVDYAQQIWMGRNISQPIFKDKGYIYGPIRLSARPIGLEYQRLVHGLSDPNYLKDKIAVFLIRDPRDILTSAYFSFGYSHGFSPVKQTREIQKATRTEIQGKSVDEYVLDDINWILDSVKSLDVLHKACGRSVVLRYEDMVNDFDLFSNDLTQYLDLSPEVIREIFSRSRPQQKEDQSSHRRSGKTSGFRSKLKPETIDSLNLAFHPFLEQFHYDE